MPTPKAYAKDVELTLFGLLTVRGDLMPARKPAGDDLKFVMVCPEDDEPTKLNQQYFCEHGHGPYTPSTAQKAKQIGTGKAATLHKVTAEQIEAMKTPTLPTGQMSVHVFPAAQVEAATIPSGSAYRLRPEGRLDLYAVLVDLLTDESLAFIGEMTVRGDQKMWRITSRAGQLFLSELVRPEDVADADDIGDVTYDAKALEMVTGLAQDNLEEFDPEAFSSEVKQRAREMSALLAAGKGEAVPTEAPAAPAAESGDLMAMLEQAAAATKKPAKKKPAAKK